MGHTLEEGRWVAKFRPSGWSRWVSATFLTVWIAMWAVGEAFSLALLLALVVTALSPELWRAIGAPRFAALGQASWFVVVFLIVWVTMWTFGGLAAIREWLRLIAGEDRVTWDASGVELASRAGPIAKRRSWSRDEVVRITTGGRARALTLHTGREAHVLTSWGTLAEREALRDDLRRSLGPPVSRKAELPAGWSSEPDSGGTILRRDPRVRRNQARVAWGVTIALAGLAVAVHTPTFARGDWGVAQVIAAGAAMFVLGVFAAGSAWLSHGGTDYIVRQGAVEKRGWFLNRRWNEVLEPLRLRVTQSTDSDGDEWLELKATSGTVSRGIERRMNDLGDVLRLAHWLADRTGARLEIDRGVDDEERSAAS